jgi:S-(hydroxymethyl)glutathione dehydrogenase/alcohol dehydrogenase
MLTIDPKQMNQGKQLRGTWGGDTRPDRDFPRYAGLVAAGKLPAARLISQTFALAEVNQALDNLETGSTPRPLLDMSR